MHYKDRDLTKTFEYFLNQFTLSSKSIDSFFLVYKYNNVKKEEKKK